MIHLFVTCESVVILGRESEIPNACKVPFNEYVMILKLRFCDVFVPCFKQRVHYVAVFRLSANRRKVCVVRSPHHGNGMYEMIDRRIGKFFGFHRNE